LVPSTPTPRQTSRRLLINTGALASSSLWRIVISFLLQLFIARRLGVASLGQYTIALAYLNVCQVISELGLPALLVRDLAQMPWLRRSYFYLALRIQIVAALLAWGGLIVVTMVLPLPTETRTILWVVGASLPFYAVTSASQLLFQAGERMEYVMGIELLINTLILLLSLAVLVAGGGTVELVALLVGTQLISAGASLFLVWRSALLAEPQEKVAWQWSMLWQRSGPFFGLALADVLLQRTDIVLLSIFGGEVTTGIYSAAYNLLRVGLKLIQNFWAALYPTLSRLYHQGPTHYRRLCDFAMHYSLLALLGAAAIGAGITPAVLRLVYGDGFTASALVLQILLWTAPFYLLESFTQTLLMVEHKPLQSLLITGLHLAALLLLLPPLVTLAMDAAVGMGQPEVAAIYAALAVLIAGACGGFGSIYLRKRWSLPGRLRRPWLIGALVILTSLLALYLPLGWGWRLLINSGLFLFGSWVGGLIDRQDWQLLRRAFRSEEAKSTG
jgi:O-antigen/teichoic acid export membrane protein